MAENIVPLCGNCHRKLHAALWPVSMLRLTRAEIDYMRSFRR